MCKTLIVHLFQGLCNLTQVDDHLTLYQSHAIIHKVEQSSTFHILQHNVDVVDVRNDRIVLDDVWVA